jgi:cytochrome P450
MEVEHYRDHFEPLMPPEDVVPASRFLLANDPVVWSDRGGGFWVVNRHADVLAVMQDAQRFVSGNRGVRVPDEPVERPHLPPIDSNPPVHRQVRQLENPFLSPQALAGFEEMFRAVIGGLLDSLVGAGAVDAMERLGKVFASDLTFRALLGVENPVELEQVRSWVGDLSDLFRHDPEALAQEQAAWTAWCEGFVERCRRHGGSPIMRSLLGATTGPDRLLDQSEVVGAVQILVFGGFNTTADATANILVRLIDHPDLLELLRRDPSLVPLVIEEVLRLEPPVTSRPRRCAMETEVGGKKIRAGERVICNYVAANRDPAEWDEPEDFRLDRGRNRLMTFGAGPHRCLGSNMARMTLRILVEELLLRVSSVRFAQGGREQRASLNAQAWRSVVRLPVVFEPMVPGTRSVA